MGAQASKANLELPFYDRHPAQEVNDVQTLVQDETLDDNITKCTRPKLKKQLSIELKVDLMCEDEELSTEWDIIRADYEENQKRSPVELEGSNLGYLASSMFSPKALEQIKVKLSNLRDEMDDFNEEIPKIENGVEFSSTSTSSSYENINLEASESTDTKDWRILPPLTKAKRPTQALQRLSSVVNVSESEECVRFQVQNCK